MTDNPTPEEVIRDIVKGALGNATDIANQIITALTAANYTIEPGWRDIEEAPKDGTPLLLIGGDHIDQWAGTITPCIGLYEPDPDNEIGWWSHYGNPRLAPPTHFRPLPPPPGETHD